MVLYIAGKISDKSILESGFRSEFNLTDFKSAFANNYGGVYTDYYIYQDDETSEDDSGFHSPFSFQFKLETLAVIACCSAAVVCVVVSNLYSVLLMVTGTVLLVLIQR